MILKYEFGFETALNLHAEGTGKRAPWKIASRRIAPWKISLLPPPRKLTSRYNSLLPPPPPPKKKERKKNPSPNIIIFRNLLPR